MTIKKNLEYKKCLPDKAQDETKYEPPEADEPPKDKYARFETWTKRELCDKIFDLEAQYEELLHEYEHLRLSAMDKAG